MMRPLRAGSLVRISVVVLTLSAALMSAAPARGSADVSRSGPVASHLAVQTPERAEAEDKLDPRLLAAVERAPDRVLRIVLRTTAERDRKARALERVGFVVHAVRAESLVISATPREALVLAEDSDILALRLLRADRTGH